MPVVQKNWKSFKDHFAQTYRQYKIHKKATYAAHGYDAAAKHAQEKYYQMMTADKLQALTNSIIENK